MADVTNFGDYSVKAVKSFEGREGYGFNCNLYRNGKKVGSCVDDAHGGEMYPISWTNHETRQEEQRLLNEFIATLPAVPFTYEGVEPLKIDESWFVTELVNEFERQKDMRKMQRQCLTKTLFRLATDNRGSYRIFNAPYNELMRSELNGKYAGQELEIFNVVLAQGNIPSVLQ